MSIQNAQSLIESIRAAWSPEGGLVKTLQDYIKIPNVSSAFDANWKANGHMDRAAELFCAWAKDRAITGLKVEIKHLPGLTPVLVIDVPGTAHGNVLLYAHMDK